MAVRKQTTLRGGRSLHGIGQQQIVDAAIAIGDAEGLERLTMRRLAAHLEVGTMTLYNYFRNKHELLDAMADAVLGKLELPTGRGKDPLSAARMIAHAFREMMRAHPTVMRLLTSRTTRSLNAMQGSYEQPLDVLVQSGLSTSEAIHVYGLLLTYAMGFVSYELPRPWGRDGDDPQALERRREREGFYRSLPPSRFPIMSESGQVLVSLPSDDQFEWGLDVLLAGVASTLRTVG